jgi:hypothetical protein
MGRKKSSLCTAENLRAALIYFILLYEAKLICLRIVGHVAAEVWRCRQKRKRPPPQPCCLELPTFKTNTPTILPFLHPTVTPYSSTAFD